ncbi:MAG TPA: hypothetical protein VIC84_23670 [Blastocatellia bacterium]|jgi:hypothetical protein
MAQNGTDRKLTPRQERAIEALLETSSVSEAAKVSRVGRRSLYRWLADPGFLAALREARAKVFDRTIEALSVAAKLAVDVLREVMSDEKSAAAETASVRVRAARVALGAMLRAHGLIELEERMRLVEQQMKAMEYEPQTTTWKN